MRHCTCDARFSGIDEAEYQARGCPECTCESKEAQLRALYKENRTLNLSTKEGLRQLKLNKEAIHKLNSHTFAIGRNNGSLL